MTVVRADAMMFDSLRHRMGWTSTELTGRGKGFVLGGIVSFAAAHLLSTSAFDYVTSLLIGLLACGWLFVTLQRPRIEVSRIFDPEMLAPDQEATVQLNVDASSLIFGVANVWRDSLPGGIMGSAHGKMDVRHRERVRRNRSRFSYKIVGLRRGNHFVGPLEIRLQDPFGLFARRLVDDDTESIVVLPERVDLPRIAFPTRNREGSRLAMPQRAGLGEDDVIARDYLPGDPMHRMHWKATAHQGELMVRQEEQHQFPSVAIVLDVSERHYGSRRRPTGEAAYSPIFEWAISTAASITTHFALQGFSVTVLSSSGGLHRSLGDSTDSIDDVMSDLAVLEPSEAPPCDLRADIPRGAMVIAILGRVKADSARSWAELDRSRGLVFVAAGASDEAREILTAHHRRVVAYHANDDLARLWTSGDGSYATR